MNNWAQIYIDFLAEVDLSSTITYTECNKGFEQFTESGDGFPRLTYTPCCAYVPNFQFKPNQRSSVTTTIPKQSTNAASPKSSRSTPVAAMPSTSTPKPSTSTQARPPQAGPLPTKSGLPAPSVVLPTNLPTSTPRAGNAYPEPSAPPVDVMPPSYEEVMAGMTGLVPEVQHQFDFRRRKTNSNEYILNVFGFGNGLTSPSPI